jgi:hypothetical protein
MVCRRRELIAPRRVRPRRWSRQLDNQAADDLEYCVARETLSIQLESSRAKSLGFAGTVSKDSEQATGFATLPSGDVGGGPNTPMLPHTWTPKDGKGIP